MESKRLQLVTAVIGMLLVLPATGALDEERFEFGSPEPRTYQLESAIGRTSTPPAAAGWIKARIVGSPSAVIELGPRLVLQLEAGVDADALLKDSPARLSRTLASNLFILQAPDALTAAREAGRFARLPGVGLSHPVVRRPQLRKHGPYATRPNDTYFSDQWYLENRDANGAVMGPDLNARGAWPFTRGEGVILAIADDGVELSHPEFAQHANNGWHFNFETMTTNAMPVDVDDNHSTAVGGLALAQGNNQRGMTGVAPEAQLASWKIFRGDALTASDEAMMDMFQFRSNVVAVQNHSWGNSDFPQLGPTVLEGIGISNAVAYGRGGRGVLMVRSGGNGRDSSMNANDDGYANDPRAIAVGAVRTDGRAASYSNPGACLLVAAPGADSDRSVFMTDRQGPFAGYNTGFYTNDLADYVSSPNISGTSFSTPQVAGLAALILSVHPTATYRDVQQMILLASRHFDLADPDLHDNGAGIPVSHNVGFGIPDAARAVTLARLWTNRPPKSVVWIPASNPQSIPNEGLRVVLPGANTPPALVSIRASPGTGLHPDAPTPTLPLVDVGLANAPITNDLSGKAALIQRDGTVMFSEKIERAAQAGANFAVIFNHTGGTDRFVLGGTDFVPIPTVMIDQNSGTALRNHLSTNPNAPARLELMAAQYSFPVTDTLICEHVGLRVRFSHPRRGDLRITLLSPNGTRSVLQQVNLDDSPASDWTYSSTHHFYEGSAGNWIVAISDAENASSGSVQSVELFLHGVPIADADRDGLDDAWEVARLGSMVGGPKDDPEGDGYNHAREQVMGTDPNAADEPFALNLSRWDSRVLRLSWPFTANRTYEVSGTPNLAGAFAVITNLPGRFPETEWFVSRTNFPSGFFRVRAVTP